IVLRVLILILADLLLLSSHVFAQPAVPFPPSEEPPVLAPKLQKELGKALEALRADKPAEARSHLDAVYRSAPGDADANFLFGIYSAEMNDWVHAKSYWEKVLVLAPNHLSALLSLGGALMRENKSAEAAQYLNRAVEVLSRLGRFVFPHEGAAQGEQGAQMVWSENEDFFPIALGVHPIVHLRGIDSKKEVGVRVTRSRPINRIQVAARLSRLVGTQGFQCFSKFLLQLGR